MKFKIVEKTFEYEPKPEFRQQSEIMFHEFLIDENSSVDFQIDEEMIETKRKILYEMNHDLTAEMIDMSALMAVIADLLRPYGNLFLHSAVVVVDGQAYAFTGHSGIGKSTQCNLWLKHFGKRAYILNGDKVFYHRNNGKWEAYGTPWKGKENFGINGHAPLKGIFYLSQASANQIHELSQGDKAERLILQTYSPKQMEAMDQQLTLLDEFVKEVPGYLLECTISDEAVRMAYRKFNDVL